jgi:hypothetical protein
MLLFVSDKIAGSPAHISFGLLKGKKSLSVREISREKAIIEEKI